VFWQLMDIGIGWMILVAQWVAALPGAVGRMAAFGTGPLLVATVGMIVLGLLRTPLRFAGLAVIAVAALWALATPQPDILVSSDGQNIGVRGKDGRLHLMRIGKDAFLVKEWLAADADARIATDPSLMEGVSCDGAGCVVEMRDGSLAALSIRPDAFADDCARAALLVSHGQPPADCAAYVVDQARLRRSGSLALRRRDGTFIADAQKPAGRDRPWAPAVPIEEGQAAIAPNRTSDRPVDVTPAESDRLSDE
jgi:competence protein ComEC